jgi:hypothetical protein
MRLTEWCCPREFPGPITSSTTGSKYIFLEFHSNLWDQEVSYTRIRGDILKSMARSNDSKELVFRIHFEFPSLAMSIESGCISLYQQRISIERNKIG